MFPGKWSKIIKHVPKQLTSAVPAQNVVWYAIAHGQTKQTDSILTRHTSGQKRGSEKGSEMGCIHSSTYRESSDSSRNCCVAWIFHLKSIGLSPCTLHCTCTCLPFATEICFVFVGKWAGTVGCACGINNWIKERKRDNELTIHFEENHFTDTRTNVVLGLAQKMSLRLFADLLEVDGAIGKELHTRFIEEILVFPRRWTDGLFPGNCRLWIPSRLAMQQHIGAGLSTRVLWLQYPFRWHIHCKRHSESFHACHIAGNACVVARMIRCNVLDDQAGGVLI